MLDLHLIVISDGRQIQPAVPVDELPIVDLEPFKLLRIVIPLLALCIIGELYLLNYAIPKLMHLSHLMRGIAAIILVAPLGLLMGMPFPTGLRHVDSFRPELSPWAWGINAFATVIGSIICVLISSLAGFTVVLLIGAGIYIIGWLVFSVSQPKSVAS